jgi:hypothetical protein
VANSTLADNARTNVLTTSTLSNGGAKEASAGDGVVTQAVGPVSFGTPAGDGSLTHKVSQPPFETPAGDGAPGHGNGAASPAVGQAAIAAPANEGVATHTAAPGDTVDISALLSSLAATPYHGSDLGADFAGAQANEIFATPEASTGAGQDNGPSWADIAVPDDTMNVVVGPYIPSHIGPHYRDWWG